MAQKQPCLREDLKTRLIPSHMKNNDEKEIMSFPATLVAYGMPDGAGRRCPNPSAPFEKLHYSARLFTIYSQTGELPLSCVVTHAMMQPISASSIFYYGTENPTHRPGLARRPWLLHITLAQIELLRYPHSLTLYAVSWVQIHHQLITARRGHPAYATLPSATHTTLTYT